MKQTKKLTRNQWKFLEAKYHLKDTRDLRVVDDNPTHLIVQNSKGEIIKYEK